MKFKYFSINYRKGDILLEKKHKLHLSHLFCCNHTCYCVNMVSVTPLSRYIRSATYFHPRYQSRSSMYIRCLILLNFAELAEAVPIGFLATGPKSIQRNIKQNGILTNVLLGKKKINTAT